MVYIYTPMMRTKAGELEALRRQDPSSFARIYPIFHLTLSVPVGLHRAMSALFVGKTIGLDGLFSFQNSGSGVNYVQQFMTLRSSGINVIPSLTVGSNPSYVAVALNLVNQVGQRSFIKVNIQYLHQLMSWCMSHGINTPTCDLILDVAHLADTDLDLYSSYISTQLGQVVATNWRSVTLVSAAAPKDYSALSFGLNFVPRKDWLLWQAVYQGVPYQLNYGDYATVHPDLSEPPGVAMARATVSVRYTIDKDWIILKGVSMSGPRGQPMGLQYRTHAQTLVAQPSFNHVANCSADAEIASIASGQNVSSGSRATWVRLGIDRHFAMVNHQLP